MKNVVACSGVALNEHRPLLFNLNDEGHGGIAKPVLGLTVHDTTFT